MGFKRRFIGACCLLMLFVAYQVSITAFTHVHYVNGVLIAHSHPFHGAHSHSKAALLVIARLDSFHALEVEEPLPVHVERTLLVVLEVSPTISACCDRAVGMHALRSPPSPQNHCPGFL